MSKYILSDIYVGNFPTTQRYNDNPQNYPMFAIPGHEGWDIATPNGTLVLAPFNGIILRDTFEDKDYGNFTVIFDPVQHCAVWYCHLLDVATIVGDKVTVGQIVGRTNNTGHSSGPHLHVNFVETDALGNRLNKDNGKQGFLNILDPDLVGWKPAATPTPTPSIPSQPQFNDQTIIPASLLSSPDYPVSSDMEIQAIRGLLGDYGRYIKSHPDNPPTPTPTIPTPTVPTTPNPSPTPVPTPIDLLIALWHLLTHHK